MKKILTLLLTTVIISSIGFQTIKADTLSTNTSTTINSTTSDNSTVSYISLDDAKLLAYNTILTRAKEDSECPWKSGVQIGNIETLYDLDDVANSYVFNLVQGSKPSGYIFVNANSEAPSVEAFSYAGSFYGDKMLQQNINQDKKFANRDKKVYYLSAYSLVVKNNESGKEVLYDAATKNKIDVDKDSLKKSYKDNMKNQVNKKAKELLNNLKSDNLLKQASMSSNVISPNSVTSNTQIIYQKYDVPYLTSTHFYTTDETYTFCNKDNNCSPTAALTLIEYWVNQRGVSSLQGGRTTSGVYNCLYYDMHTNAGHTGTYPSDIYNGILNYAKWVYCPAHGSAMVGNPTYAQVINDIASGVPIEADIRDVSPYGDHSIDIFGIENDSDGQWCRIADGWTNTNNYQTWCTFTYLHPIDILYGRWN